MRNEESGTRGLLNLGVARVALAIVNLPCRRLSRTSCPVRFERRSLGMVVAARVALAIVNLPCRRLSRTFCPVQSERRSLGMVVAARVALVIVNYEL